MGGEVWLLMASKKELKRARTFLETVCEKDDSGELCLEAPKLDGKDIHAGCWIEFKRNRIEVGYQIFHMCSAWATAVACGIRDHFNIKKGGWDSVGYSKDFMTTRPFRVDMNMVERVIQKGQGKHGGLIGKNFNKDYAMYKRYRKVFEDRIDKLFDPLKARRKPKPKHVVEKLPKIKIWGITWRKDKALQGIKTIDVEVAEVKCRDDLKDRFVVYTSKQGEKINMWTLYDAKTKTQHFIMHEEATRRVSEVLNGEWGKDGK